MNNDELIWNYQNNAPFAVIKAAMSHSLYMCSAILIFSFIITIGTKSNYEQIFYFSLISFLSSPILLTLLFIPLLIVHYIHYKIFKKVLLKNKLENNVLIGLFLLLAHFSIAYFLIDLVMFRLEFNLPPTEFTLSLLSHLIGLTGGFVTFNKQFYHLPPKDDDSLIKADLYLDNEKSYF